VLAEGVGGLGVNGAFAGVGAAIDDDGFHGVVDGLTPNLHIIKDSLV
jgi:hypothetical protein